jgi:hypothetical protein
VPSSGWRTTPRRDEPLRRSIKQQLRDAFYVETAAWQQQVVGQTRDATRLALEGLVRN